MYSWAIFLFLTSNFATSLKVSIYYETLCPDSVRFIANQLYPVYDKISDTVDIDFVPYGKATQVYENGTWSFECQHGPNECYGNKYHACVLNQNVGQDKHVDYVYCSMSAGYPGPAAYETLYNCALKHDIPWAPVQACFENEGDELLSGHGNKTHVIMPAFVPTITYDEVFDQGFQDLSLTNFFGVLCSKITEYEQPVECTPRTFGNFLVLTVY